MIIILSSALKLQLGGKKMDKLLIEKTESSPYVCFDAGKNFLIIQGESFPENAAKFYTPVLDWLHAYLQTIKQEEVVVEFEIIYFNSSTSKIFMNFFQMLDEAVATGKNITLNWRCNEENETAIECGEEFKEDIEYLPFNIVLFKGV